MLLEFLNNVIPSQFPYAVQLYVSGCLFACRAKKRPNFWPRFALCSVAFLVIGWFVPDVLLAGFFFVPAFVLIPTAVLAFMVILDTDIKRVIFIVLNTFLLQHITECVTWLLREAFDIAEGGGMWMALSFICYPVFYVAGYFILVRRRNILDLGMQPWKITVLGSVTFMLVYIVREVINNLIKINKVDFSVINITVNFYSALTCVLLFIIFYSVNNTDTLMEDKQILQELLRREQATYKMISENIDSINYKCHDLKHQIAYLRDPINSEEREKYIAKLEHDVMIYERTPKTGNAALDTTLASKSLLCEQKDIEFVFIADAKGLEFMEPTDVYSLIGNAMDNAIECVAKYEDREKRQISMQLASVGNILRICVENYCEDDLVIRDGAIVTSKTDKRGHGFGLKSMHYVVEKYGGYMNVEQRGHLFVLTILFSLDELPGKRRKDK